MKTYSMVTADFGFLILGIVMTILVCVMPLVHQESLMFMENTKTSNKSDMLAPDAKESLLLEVTYSDANGVKFYITEADQKISEPLAKDQAITILKQNKPEDIRLRVDRRVPNGEIQDIALAVQGMGARLWQVSESR